MPELHELGLTNTSRAAAALTPKARQLHLLVLAAFAKTGRPPLRAELERTAGQSSPDPEAVLAELADRHVLAFDEHGEIRAAYPFSPTPTAIRVTWAGGPAVHAMCAIDALGMSAMLDRPVTITASEPGSGATVTVEVDQDRARWSPQTAVVCTGARCGHINFFTTAETARAWAGRHPEVNTVVLDQAQALACAIADFGALMQPGT